MIFDAHCNLPTYAYEKRREGKTAVLENEFAKFFGKYITSRVIAIWSKPEKRATALRYALELTSPLP